MSEERAIEFHRLSFVPDGEDVVVGRVDTGSYAVLPADGAELLRRLSSGLDRYAAAEWYRTEFDVPELVSGQRFWLRFDGISYSARIWLNGTSVGSIEGAFKRGVFDVTDLIAKAQRGNSTAGRTAYRRLRLKR